MPANAQLDIVKQRSTIKAELKRETEKVKELIPTLYPGGSYAQYVEIHNRRAELEIYWGVLKGRIYKTIFNFDGILRDLQQNEMFDHREWLVGELKTASSQNLHGFVNKIEELGNSLQMQEKEYTKFPSVAESIQKIMQLKTEEMRLRIVANSSYGMSPKQTT